MHGLQVSGTDQPNRYLRLIGHRLQRPPFDRNRLIGAAAVQRQVVDDASGFDSRQCSHLLQHLVIKRNFLGGLAVRGIRYRWNQGKHIARIKARIDSAQHPQTAYHQPRSDKQHE